MEAVMSAMRRLDIHRVFITTASLDFWKDGVVKSGMVELTKFPLIVRWEICVASCIRRWLVRSSGCCCRFLYDSMMNAVMAAENRPACNR